MLVLEGRGHVLGHHTDQGSTGRTDGMDIFPDAVDMQLMPGIRGFMMGLQDLFPCFRLSSIAFDMQCVLDPRD